MMKPLALLRKILFVLGTALAGGGVLALGGAVYFVIVGVSTYKAGDRIAAGHAKVECILCTLIGVHALGLAFILLVPALILHLWIRRGRRVASTGFPVLPTPAPPPVVPQSAQAKIQ